MADSMDAPAQPTNPMTDDSEHVSATSGAFTAPDVLLSAKLRRFGKFKYVMVRIAIWNSCVAFVMAAVNVPGSQHEVARTVAGFADAPCAVDVCALYVTEPDASLTVRGDLRSLPADCTALDMQTTRQVIDGLPRTSLVRQSGDVLHYRTSTFWLRMPTDVEITTGDTPSVRVTPRVAIGGLFSTADDEGARVVAALDRSVCRSATS